MVEAEVHQHRGSPPTAITFDTLHLRFSPSNEWSEARWQFSTGGTTHEFPADHLNEITTKSRSFEVVVIDGLDQEIGRFLIQSMICEYPSHSFCFLFSVDQDGMWSGHTVTKSFGKIVVAPLRVDPG